MFFLTKSATQQNVTLLVQLVCSNLSFLQVLGKEQCLLIGQTLLLKGEQAGVTVKHTFILDVFERDSSVRFVGVFFKVTSSDFFKISFKLQ